MSRSYKKVLGHKDKSQVHHQSSNRRVRQLNKIHLKDIDTSDHEYIGEELIRDGCCYKNSYDRYSITDWKCLYFNDHQLKFAYTSRLGYPWSNETYNELVHEFESEYYRNKIK